MKQSITQSSNWSKSLRQEFVFRIVTLTVLLSFVFVGGFLFIYQYNSKLKSVLRREAVQKIILNNLISSAKFGDIIYSRAEAIELGNDLGLVDLGICRSDRDIFERINDTRCKNKYDDNFDKARSVVALGSEKYEVEFTWKKEEFSIYRAFLVALVASFGISLFVVFPAFFYLFKKFHTKVQDAILIILNRHLEADKTNEYDFSAAVPVEFENLDRIIESKNNELRKITSEKVYFDLAKKVSHDIRSPLIVLNRLAKVEYFTSEENRVIVKYALLRINSIAEDLLRRNGSITYKKEMLSLKDVLYLAKNLVKEKEFELNTQAIELIFVNNFTESEMRFRVEIDSNQYLRILSNLINNSAEAIFEKTIPTGFIKISLRIVSKYFCVEISDDGIGIEEEVLLKLKTSGLGKSSKGGNGIGLSSAVQYMKFQGGYLDIRSKKGEGSIVENYFVLNENEDTIIPEDDQSIDFIFIDDEQINHLMWKKDAKKNNFFGKFYKNTEEFLGGKNEKISFDVPIFVDFYLDGKNGMDEAKILFERGYKRIYLCTSVQFQIKDVPNYILQVVGKEFPYSFLRKE